jgi:hypothetical protein
VALSHVLPCFPILMLSSLHLVIFRHPYLTHTKSDFRDFCFYEFSTSYSSHLLFRFPFEEKILPSIFEKILWSRVVTRTFSDGRTDDRTMAAGASVTWTHCSVLFEVTWGKTEAFAWTLACVRADAPASAWTGSVQAMDAKGLHKGSSNVPFSLPSSPWPREATVCLVHFVVWAVIRGSFFWSYLSLFCRSSFSLLSLLKTISRS